MEAPVNLRMTKQRQVILDELRKMHSHPTADEMYRLLRRRLPKISLGTVYRNLEVLSDVGLIQKIEVAGTQKRFDGNASHHYHVRCKRCLRLEDVYVDVDTEMDRKVSRLTEYDITLHRMEFIGVCPSCQAGAKQEDFS